MSPASIDPTTHREWLIRGLYSGALLAGVESLFTLGTGFGLAPGYFVALFVFNASVGAFVGAAVSIVSRFLNLQWGSSFSSTFTPIATAAFFLFFLDKSIVAARARARPGWVGIAVLIVLAGVLSIAVVLLTRVLRKNSGGDLSLGVCLVAWYLFLVGGNWLAWLRFGSYKDTRALVANAVLGAITVAVMWMQKPIAVRFRQRFNPSRLLVWTIVAGVGAGASAIAWGIHPVASVQDKLCTTQTSLLEKTPIVLITIDTLRADRLSVYGYSRRTTPALEKLAADGVIYENTLSPATWSLPGHASILTGMYARRHGAHVVESGTNPEAPDSIRWIWRGPRFRPLRQNILTLPELLSTAGYHTGGFVANFAYLNGTLGFARGFEVYDDRAARLFGYVPLFNSALKLFPHPYVNLTKPYRLAEQINRGAFEWLDRHREEPFFLFLNYMEPHAPYCAPRPHHGFHAEGEAVYEDPLAYQRSGRSFSRRQRSSISAQYDEEIAYLDEQIGDLLRKLQTLGLYDKSLILVTSDHGEYFGEHDMWGHGSGPYDGVHRVPLIVKFPGSSIRGVEPRWVQTIDIFPTVLEAVGLDLPKEETIDGQPLSRVEHPILTEQYPNAWMKRNFGARYARGYRSLYQPPWKFVAYMDGSVELFDLADDPDENHDLAATRPDRSARMKADLDRFVASVTPSLPSGGKNKEMDEQTKRRLRALGYIR